MLLTALHAAGYALDRERCWLLRQSFHFVLRDAWSIAITPDAADRLRVEVFHGLHRVPNLTHWVMVEDSGRLIEVINDLASAVNGDLQEVT
jgi:hypothetical protein